MKLMLIFLYFLSLTWHLCDLCAQRQLGLASLVCLMSVSLGFAAVGAHTYALADHRRIDLTLRFRIAAAVRHVHR
jgi:hypothetical protein